MEVKTYRARSVQEALALVRQDLGPDAAVLHTREVHKGLWRLFGRRSEIEVVASAEVFVPSRWPETARDLGAAPATAARAPFGETSHELEPPPLKPPHLAAADAAASRPVEGPSADELRSQLNQLQSMVEHLYQQRGQHTGSEMPESLFRLFTELLDAEFSDELARHMIDRIRAASSPADLDDELTLKARLLRLVEDEIRTCGPIQVTAPQRRLVALVGPTGVGKTTTIAKLAADFHLRQQLRVGLITVDTYRIAAVEQLRTYADIIDLPMEVVSTPREMRAAVERMTDRDLILMDTAGRSPRDEVKIQELRSMLAEAKADEVHLVLSSVASVASLKNTASKFAGVGATSIILTKLDEATGLGNLLPLLRSSDLPLSYVTNGQNVPDDIEAADARRLARWMLGADSDERRLVRITN